MLTRIQVTIAATAILFLAGCQARPERVGPMTTDGRVAPLLDNLGDFHREVTTSEAMAQRFFDQGMILLYGFNHAEAARSFREVARIDPNCAMAYWGEAIAEGPNINDPKPDAEREQRAYEAIRKAVALKAHASPVEQALIEAAARRFSDNQGADRTALNEAYAAAMKEVHEQYPDDPDVAVLYAASCMNTTPWDYWIDGKQPKPEFAPVVLVLEATMRSAPEHPGAHHYYIHAVEASNDPDRAVPSADKLGGLAPGAGHLVHMPSHIYIRVGRYADATEANRRAIAADEDYLTQCRSQGIYPAAYYPHNIHFMTATLSMEGRSTEALKAAAKVAAAPDDAAYCMPGFGFPHLLRAQTIFTMVRFGLWDEILAEPEFPSNRQFAEVIRHYARGLAWLSKENLKAAEEELAIVRELIEEPVLEELKIWEANSLAELARIGENVLAGEIAAKRGNTDEAVNFFRRAIESEDNLVYSEPPDWPIPVRHNLGAVLLEAGRPVQAEVVYRADLNRHRNNGWALAGRIQALEAQGKKAKAAEATAEFARVWARADVKLPGSRF